MQITMLFLIPILTVIKLHNCEEALVTSEASLSIGVGGQERTEQIGTIKIGLFGTVVPKTVKNFEALAKNEVIKFLYN